MNEFKNRMIPAHLDPAAPEFDLFQSPFYLIAHADFMFHEDLDKAIEKFGLDRTTYRLLTILKSCRSINIKDLSAFALIKRTTTSRALLRMQKEGWISQSSDSKDNRITNVELSPAGHELAGKVMRFGSRQLKRAVQGLEAEQLEELVRLLNHLVHNLSKSAIE